MNMTINFTNDSMSKLMERLQVLEKKGWKIYSLIYLLKMLTKQMLQASIEDICHSEKIIWKFLPSQTS
jgi:hypothetical protein